MGMKFGVEELTVSPKTENLQNFGIQMPHMGYHLHILKMKLQLCKQLLVGLTIKIWGFAQGVPELWGFKVGVHFLPNFQQP